ncbi:MAG: hypothetical protein U1D25_18390 [Hydrogenophaga sp.]|uniref:hypothetical protein n=1 Tax=Hydrogenophaga sp. TaxID=1904254 RepID=UPI00276B80F5|nr:hypothetical protein [Hydrogenophaga sp.]MDP2417485.1 hypothetical protein [Hydrogenophaga sp.]MDZ4190055.1 hypothetical protein [Hydrogenophaga sp.]
MAGHGQLGAQAQAGALQHHGLTVQTFKHRKWACGGGALYDLKIAKIAFKDSLSQVRELAAA